MRVAVLPVALLGLGAVACSGEVVRDALAAPVAEAGPDVVAGVGEPVTLDGSASQGTAFRWGTGDGVLLDGAIVEHTYTSPGRYAAVLEVTGEDGTRRTDATTVLVTHPRAEPAPTRSSPLALGADGTAWLVVPEAAVLVRVRPGPDVAPEVHRVPVCPSARAIAVGTERIAIACPEVDAVHLLTLDDLAAQAVVVPTGRGSRPVAVAAVPGEDHDGPWIVAAEGTGEVLWVDRAGRVAGRVEVGGDPVGLAVLPGGEALVSRLRGVEDTSRVHRVGAAAGEVETLELAYEPGPDTDTNSRGVAHLVAQLAVSPDGRTAYLPGVQANTARGPSRDGRSLTFETTVRAHLSVVDLVGWREPRGRRKVFDDQGRALAVVASPAGDLVWTSHPGTGVVHAVDAFDGALRGSVLGAGRGVVGLAMPDADTLYAYAWLDRELHAYDVGAEPPERRWTVSLLEREPLSAEILRGKQLFWEAGDPRLTRAGYLACVHCHPDGDQDGLVWDFGGRGEGVRNTISLLGRGGLAHGPLHWSANFDEVQDFEHDLRGPNAGRGLLGDADFAATDDPLGAPKAGLSAELDALAAYVSSLDETPTPAAPPASAAAFQQAGCPDCHPAPTYTDSGTALHDIGTLTEASGQRLGGPLDGLDTPTLLGVSTTPPYLHDGSAPTLRDAVRAHDGASELTDAEIDAIVAFLRGL